MKTPLIEWTEKALAIAGPICVGVLCDLVAAIVDGKIDSYTPWHFIFMVGGILAGNLILNRIQQTSQRHRTKLLGTMTGYRQRLYELQDKLQTQAHISKAELGEWAELHNDVADLKIELRDSGMEIGDDPIDFALPPKPGRPRLLRKYVRGIAASVYLVLLISTTFVLTPMSRTAYLRYVSPSTPTPTPTATAIPTQTTIPLTDTPQPSVTPTARPAPTHTALLLTDTPSPSVTASLARPTATGAQPATVQPTLSLAVAPILLSPAHGEALSGTSVILTWTWGLQLQADEYFDVRVWREGDAAYGIAWTEESYLEAKGLAAADYYWSIAVVRHVGTNPDGTKEWEPVSQESEVRSFSYWPQPPTPFPSPSPSVYP